MSHAHVDVDKLMSRDNTAFPAGAGKILWIGLLAAGVVCAAIAILKAKNTEGLAGFQLVASYHAGLMAAVGASLGALFLVMVFHQTNAGWSALIRRQVENLTAFFPFMILLGLPLILFKYDIWEWMNTKYVESDPLYQSKASFLNENFFWMRSIAYFLIWFWLARSLVGFSKRQDETGDKWLTAKARRRSSYGLLLFAMTTAFAGFDWIMTMDYHWFSTMWGVYFFAQGVGAALALTLLILLILNMRGKLDGLVTVEHHHDLAKLIFGFTVFWAYIGFSQYFLIWYANIPEETAWFALRRTGPWMNYSMALAAGRFIVPFLILMPRPFRRNRMILMFTCVWIIAFHVFDLLWVIRAEAHDGAHGPVALNAWDALAFAGPLLIFAGVVVMKIVSGPLVPLKDPRFTESLGHKNYV